MSHAPIEIPSLLRTLAEQINAGDQAAQLQTIERIGLGKLFELETLLGALRLGGAAYVGFIADLATEHATEPERYRRVLEVCGASSGQKVAEVAARIIVAFGGDLSESSRAEMEKLPRAVYAHLTTCLHKLGRYVEAEETNLSGLGTSRDLITLKGEPPTEAALLRAWPRHAEPVISVVCMTYNQERYIDGAIRSFLLQQTKFPFEILVHDDASTDGTAAKVRAWQEKYPAIVRPTLQAQNQFSRGVRPFELLLQQARGRYVAICEGDDYWLDRSKLEKQVGFLESRPDFSCAAHNYYLYNESLLSVTRWNSTNVDRVLSEQHLMNVTRLLWLPTLVFRKTFSTLPRERDFAALGDQFLTSFLGTLGKGAYFETLLGAVRRENQYSIWTPASAAKKEYARVKTWAALVRLHEGLGNSAAAAHHLRRIQASALPADQKNLLLHQSLEFQAASLAAPAA